MFPASHFVGLRGYVLKIRIFALARDLGLDSKVLIELCEEAGVKLRNALATISEEERDQVVAYVRKKGTPVTQIAPPVEVTPVRESVAHGGRVRVIGTGSVRSGSSRQSEVEEERDELLEVPQEEIAAVSRGLTKTPEQRSKSALVPDCRTETSCRS